MHRSRMALLALLALAACNNDNSAQQATVQFSLDAPFCGTAIASQFFIDGQLVGTDTFRVHLAPDHLLSRGFSVTAGSHLLGARVTLNGTSYPWPDTPDTTVTLSAGMTYTRVLPFYCS